MPGVISSAATTFWHRKPSLKAELTTLTRVACRSREKLAGSPWSDQAPPDDRCDFQIYGADPGR
jgi:hypothetical protein